jgi:hypothetical protein
MSSTGHASKTFFSIYKTFLFIKSIEKKLFVVGPKAKTIVTLFSDHLTWVYKSEQFSPYMPNSNSMNTSCFRKGEDYE